VPTATVNGLTACDWSDTADRRRLENSGAHVIEYASAIARYDGSLPFSTFDGLLTSREFGTDGALMIGSGGSSDWYVVGGQSHYRDGTPTEAVDGSLHFYEGVRSGQTRTGVVVGNLSSNADRSWDGISAEILALDAVPSSNYQEAELDYAQTKWGTP
jgi:hypothetical protein